MIPMSGDHIPCIVATGAPIGLGCCGVTLSAQDWMRASAGGLCTGCLTGAGGCCCWLL